MNSLKITIFQKDINTTIPPEVLKKILQQKSDFLILPEFYPALRKEKLAKESAENLKNNTNLLSGVSESYKGVLIGGSMFRPDEDKLYHSVPIFHETILIDWYDKRDISSDEQIASGSGEKFFIINGIRFAILIGDEIQREERLEEIQKEGINLVFHLDSVSMDSQQSWESDLEFFAELAKKFDLNILRTTGFGQAMGKEYKGRSFLATPHGITWKVAASEEEKEILKTIQINGIKALF